MAWHVRAMGWSERHHFWVDLAGTLVWALIALLMSSVPLSSLDGDWMLWAVAITAPLPWRRTRPGWSALAVYTVAFAHVLAGEHLIFPTDVAVLVSLYSVTVHGPRWAHKLAIAASLTGGLLAVGLEAADRSGLGDLYVVESSLFFAAFVTVTFLAVWALGMTRRARIDTLQALRDRADQLEGERDQQALLAAAGERARIAREMHDIVAHSLSVMIAQADGGRYAAAAHPEAATTALDTVAETGRAALADMRRLLGVLRSDDASDERAALIPQPDGHDIEDLVAEAQASGLRISFVRTGQPRALPPGAGLTVYRVCQESLTNILKHAGPDPSVTLALHWLPDALVIEVLDDGRGAAASAGTSGFGLIGMNERAALFGGTVTAGPRPGGGFQVRFRLPLPRA